MDDFFVEDLGLNSEKSLEVYKFVEENCGKELDALIDFMTVFETILGKLPVEMAASLAKGYACAVLYRYISGRNPSENSIEKLYNLPEGEE